jgi:hypothetical protein
MWLDWIESVASGVHPSFAGGKFGDPNVRDHSIVYLR